MSCSSLLKSPTRTVQVFVDSQALGCGSNNERKVIVLPRQAESSLEGLKSGPYLGRFSSRTGMADNLGSV